MYRSYTEEWSESSFVLTTAIDIDELHEQIKKVGLPYHAEIFKFVRNKVGNH